MLPGVGEQEKSPLLNQEFLAFGTQGGVPADVIIAILERVTAGSPRHEAHEDPIAEHALPKIISSLTVGFQIVMFLKKLIKLHGVVVGMNDDRQLLLHGLRGGLTAVGIWKCFHCRVQTANPHKSVQRKNSAIQQLVLFASNKKAVGGMEPGGVGRCKIAGRW